MAELAAATSSSPLALAGLSYRYPGAAQEALRDVDLTLRAGEFVLLAGRTACGKTTLLRAGCGLVPHFHGGEISGHLEVGGRDVREAGPGELAGVVGYVSQDPETQAISTTVAAEIELSLELRGHGPAARARSVEEVALALAIPHLLNRSLETLSGGELQRVALAAALVTQPELILLDEPTSQLDPVAGDELIWLLRRLNEEWGVAVLLAEHRLERCLAAVDRVVVLDQGTICFDGAPGEFLGWSIGHDPALATPAARLFTGAGLDRLPVGVREARELLGARPEPIEAAAPESQSPGGPRIKDGPLRAAMRVARGRARPSGPALAARDLWVELEADDALRDVLRGVGLELGAGEAVALMGRNGAGKSTLLRAAAGLIDPVRGSIGAPGGCALLTQSPGDFLVRERVGEELQSPGARAALSAVGLEGVLGADSRDLSGGQRQRLALAIALAGRTESGSPPDLICLDEPTRGMDRARKAELAGLIGRLRDRGVAVLVATHDVEFAASFAERVVLLGDGELLADGPAAEILCGGWYFATEVARILRRPGVITPEQGIELLRGDR